MNISRAVDVVVHTGTSRLHVAALIWPPGDSHVYDTPTVVGMNQLISALPFPFFFVLKKIEMLEKNCGKKQTFF